MKLIVGLGNPGGEYDRTRHNAGFMVVDRLAEQVGIKVTKKGHLSLFGTGTIEGEQVVLVKPQTFMNLSGNAVGSLVRWYKLTTNDLVVVYDDLDLDIGHIRIRERGGAGGHKGLSSIINQLGTQDIPRLRVGIGRPTGRMQVVDYVLSRFTVEEKQPLDTALNQGVEAVITILKDGVSTAMNRFN